MDISVVSSDELSARELADLQQLMDEAFEGRFGPDDWTHCLGGLHVVARDGEHHSLVAHAALVERSLTVGGRDMRTGYVEGVAAAPARQRTGLGSEVMRTVGRLVHDHFDLGALSTGAHRFYEALGWERWQGETFVRRGDELIRTADEDDGIMVLRHGPSATLDLGLSICCDAREGDDW
jgi:aminoglycoside 2'-N-acetyltransferase I